MNKYFTLLILICSFLSFTTSSSTTKFQLVVFEGSDWCSSCRIFENEILKDSTVNNFLDSNHIEVIRVDFPQRKKIDAEKEKQNKLMAEKYEFKGVFPTVILDDGKQKATLIKTHITPVQFIAWLRPLVHTNNTND